MNGKKKCKILKEIRRIAEENDIASVASESKHQGNRLLCAETSLAVPQDAIKTAANCIDHFYVDCKDMNPDIYKHYTGEENDLLRQNLALLLELVSPDRVTVRLPLIPGFNTEADRTHSQSVLSQMGVTKFNHLTYQVKK
jgi:pyruvate formate lyase activating enzyme